MNVNASIPINRGSIAKECSQRHASGRLKLNSGQTHPFQTRWQALDQVMQPEGNPQVDDRWISATGEALHTPGQQPMERPLEGSRSGSRRNRCGFHQTVSTIYDEEAGSISSSLQLITSSRWAGCSRSEPQCNQQCSQSPIQHPLPPQDCITQNEWKKRM